MACLDRAVTQARPVSVVLGDPVVHSNGNGERLFKRRLRFGDFAAHQISETKVDEHQTKRGVGSGSTAEARALDGCRPRRVQISREEPMQRSRLKQGEPRAKVAFTTYGRLGFFQVSDGRDMVARQVVGDCGKRKSRGHDEKLARISARCHCTLERRPGCTGSTLQDGQVSAHQVRPGPCRIRSASRGQQLVEPAHPLRSCTRDPVPPERNGEVDRAHFITFAKTATKHPPQVLHLELDQREPFR